MHKYSNSKGKKQLLTFPPLHRVKSRLSVGSTSTPLPGSPRFNHRSPAHTPTHSNLGDWSCNLAQTPSSIHSNGSCHTLTPSASPIQRELFSDSMNENSTQSRHSSSTKSSQRRGRNWVQTEEAVPRASFEPKNLLSLFEDTTLEGEPWGQTASLHSGEKGVFTLKCWVWMYLVCMNCFCHFVTVLQLLLTWIWNDLGKRVEYVIKP